MDKNESSLHLNNAAKTLNQVIEELKSCHGEIIKLINDSDADLLSIEEIKDKASLIENMINNSIEPIL